MWPALPAVTRTASTWGAVGRDHVVPTGWAPQVAAGGGGGIKAYMQCHR